MGGGFMGGQVGVARMIGRNKRRPWIGKDGGSIAPGQEKVEDDAKYGGEGAWHFISTTKSSKPDSCCIRIQLLVP